jgi:hypothetical protein
MSAEAVRLEESRPGNVGDPYLSERAWGSVREDYSAGGAAWDYFPHVRRQSENNSSLSLFFLSIRRGANDLEQRVYSEYPLRYSRVRNSFAAGLLVTRMLAPS